MIVEYEPNINCQNIKAWYVCHKCGKCGRKFIKGIMIKCADNEKEKKDEKL